jgi:hypothetical protein
VHRCVAHFRCEAGEVRWATPPVRGGTTVLPYSPSRVPSSVGPETPYMPA